ncbi:hypothetical protein SAMN05880590_102772 [Rhizobium sp. RU35A]|uniref:hypothetical protein n=1 Tax=Rhizobium sp. RU35A TaxID=1907414 RepID=UPI0009565AC0|nr:hypothetical protein [Rhizobium sp. RU35A]SIQ24554.1 hypothetical protein SAMN05880590_102772 [Rhizobium sp. RU35A]
MLIASKELSAIATDFLSRPRPVAIDELRETGRFVAHLAQLVALQERELEIHRLAEAARQGKVIIAELVDQHSAEIIRMHREKDDDKIIRPSFGRGPKGDRS